MVRICLLGKCLQAGLARGKVVHVQRSCTNGPREVGWHSLANVFLVLEIFPLNALLSLAESKLDLSYSIKNPII